MPEFDPYLAWLGIPVNQRPPTHYQLLGVDPAITDPSVVKTLALQRIAYVRNFQRSEHADACTRILEELARAEATLTDPAQRAAYDKILKPASPPPQPKPVLAKAIAIPAPRAPEPAPARKPRRSRSNTEALAIVKWTALAIVGVGLLVAAVSISRMFSGARQAMLAISFESPWPDASVVVDGRKIESTSSGAKVSLSPGEHLVAVSRGALGTFRRSLTLSPDAPSEVRVPASAFQPSNTSITAATSSTTGAAAATAAKPITIIFNPVPNDAEAVVSAGKATLVREPNTFRLSTDAAAVASGLEITFSKKGFASKTVRVRPNDANTAAVSVTLPSIKRVTLTIDVMPRVAELAVSEGQAAKVEDGRWALSVYESAPKLQISAAAPGFVAQTINTSPSNAPRRILLKASATDWWKHYKSLGPDYLLRMVGRVGSFGYGARAVALSRNGKFLAVAEGQWPVHVHVWDVDNERFVGPVMHNHGLNKVPGQGAPFAAPIAVAVSNDGKKAALSCFVLSVFDVESGKEIKRFGKDETKLYPPPREKESSRTAVYDPSSTGAGDVLSLSFSGDDDQLFTVLRSGRVVVRETNEWSQTESLAAFNPGTEDVRFTADGVFATGVTRGGPWFWRKGASAIALDKKSRFPARRWSGKPNQDLWFVAPGELGEWQTNDPWKPPPSRGIAAIEVRRYQAPARAQRKILEVFPVVAVEALSNAYVAAVVYRGLDKDASFDRSADYGLRIWSVKDGAFVGDAFCPTRIYSLQSSDDGRVIATVGEREHVVYLWKFNPNGKRSYQYSDPTGWDQFPQLTWQRLLRGNKEATYRELGGGKWTSPAGELVETLRTEYGVVFAQLKEEVRLYNNGLLWSGTIERPKNAPKQDYMPNFEGHRREEESIDPQFFWGRPARGAWSVGDLPPRRLTKTSPSDPWRDDEYN